MSIIWFDSKTKFVLFDLIPRQNVYYLIWFKNKMSIIWFASQPKCEVVDSSVPSPPQNVFAVIDLHGSVEGVVITCSPGLESSSIILSPAFELEPSSQVQFPSSISDNMNCRELLCGGLDNDIK